MGKAMKEHYPPTTRSVVLVFHKSSDRMPEIDPESPYEESPVCLFKTTYGSIVIGTVRKDFMGCPRVWTGYQSNSYSMKTEVDEWAYAEGLI